MLIRKYQPTDCKELTELFYLRSTLSMQRIIGFGAIDKTGYLDRLYVRQTFLEKRGSR